MKPLLPLRCFRVIRLIFTDFFYPILMDKLAAGSYSAVYPVAKVQTLAEFLGTAPVTDGEPAPRLEEIAGDAQAFCKAVLNSHEFRQYIVHGLTLGSIPAAIVLRVMDMAGWQKPPERVEHSGRIDSVTEVRRVVVHVQDLDEEAAAATSYTAH